MHESQPYEFEFVSKATEIVEANITNPKFGVSMLAKEMGMSRSNLHRKVNKITKITVSQFINQVRLKKAKEILRHTTNTVSEVAYEVGFNNVSYFIKCFHNYYGYSPGQVGDREETEELSNSTKGRKHLRIFYIAAMALALIGIVLIMVFKPFQFQQKKLEMKIAILPPEIYETVDTIQIFGIIQSVRNNLGKIKDVEKVTPRLSVKQYQNTTDPAPEISRELDVNYLVKPRIWVHNDNVLLSINLMEGPGDKDLETFEYPIDTNNVTTVHLDILNDITDELDISITPAERGRIDNIITSNRKAHKYYWEGVKIINQHRSSNESDLKDAIGYFEKAIEYDNECAAAYAQLAIVYYYMDYHYLDRYTPEHEILFGRQILDNALRAYQIDPLLHLSSIALALYYKNQKNYNRAISFLEDALKYNCQSSFAIYHLCNIYHILSNDEEFIKYALQITSSEYPETDYDTELGKEVIYDDLARTYRRLGFFKHAEKYFDLAAKSNPDYMFALIDKSQVIMDMEEGDYYQDAADYLLDILAKDPSSSRTCLWLGLTYYLLRDYEKASFYYEKMLELIEKKPEDIIGLSSGRIAVVYENTGKPEKAQILINNYGKFSEKRKNQEAYHYILCGYYSFLNDTAKAIEHLQKASKYSHPYFRIRMLKDAPIYDNIRGPQFDQIITQMENRFNERRDSIRKVFEKKGLLNF